MPRQAIERPADKTFMLTLDPQLHEALRLRAFKEKRSMRDIIREQLRSHLKPELKQKVQP